MRNRIWYERDRLYIAENRVAHEYTRVGYLVYSVTKQAWFGEISVDPLGKGFAAIFQKYMAGQRLQYTVYVNYNVIGSLNPAPLFAKGSLMLKLSNMDAPHRVSALLLNVSNSMKKSLWLHERDIRYDLIDIEDEEAGILSKMGYTLEELALHRKLEEEK